MIKKWIHINRSSIITMIAFIFPVAGVIFGCLIYAIYPSPWITTQLPKYTFQANKIIYVYYYIYSSNYLENNSVYLGTNADEVYLLSNGEYKLLPLLPDHKRIESIRKLNLETGSPIVATTIDNEAFEFVDNKWIVTAIGVSKSVERPQGDCTKSLYFPDSGNILDSKGLVVEHALGSEYICYVLLGNGDIRVLTRIADASSLMNVLLTGFGIGIIISIIIIITYWWRKRIIEKR